MEIRLEAIMEDNRKDRSDKCHRCKITFGMIMRIIVT